MPTDEEIQLFEETKTSLKRMQDFDISTLSREDELGTRLNFQPVLQSAKKLVDLYKRLSVTALEDFPPTAFFWRPIGQCGPPFVIRVVSHH